MTFTEVREAALAMEGVEEGTSYGTPAFRTGGRLFVRYRPELNSIVVAMDVEEREAAIQANPKTYYLVDHYLDYEWVLVRLSAIGKTALRKLLVKAKTFAESQKRRKRKSR
jgi:hypothetical protein